PYNSVTGCYGTPQNFMITVNPNPIVNITNISICDGIEQLSINPVTGRGAQAATAFNWQAIGNSILNIGTLKAATAFNWRLSGHANTFDVGLEDYTAKPPAKTAIDGFTAQNATDSPQSRDVAVTPYNSVTGCYGTPQNFMITVNPKPFVTITNISICDGADQLSINTVTGAGVQAATAFNWQVSGHVNTFDVGLADYTTQPPAKTAIDKFTAQNATDSPKSRDVGVTPYNSATGCYGT
ncbi:MAG: hypothetical protein CRN43_20340, partial [Candidatus Nephrothrix sp. EaCA]